ncbi:MAG: replication factor C large subunit [Candidatus Nanoarchaeia archaeon]
MVGEVWTLKYLPKTTSEVEGQDKAVSQIRFFVEQYKTQKKKAAFLYGDPGCGKTSAVYALAKELNLEVFELNASDFRNKDSINTLLGSAAKQMSLFQRGKILLVDEVDGLSGTKDRGGIPTIISLLKETAFPVVFTGNDPYHKKFSALRKTAVLIECEVLSCTSVFNVLKKIADNEKIKYEEDALKALARRAGGDLRAAINDLQNLASLDGAMKKDDLGTLSDRERKEEMGDALTRVFKTTDAKIAIGAFNNVNEDLNQCMLWVDENLPKEYEKPADLARAYDYLSRSDVMNRRIMRWQHWRFLVYVNAFISAGVAVSKDEKYKKMIHYAQTGRLLKIYLANMKYNKRKNIAAKIAAKTHTSVKEIITDTMPYVRAMMKHDDMADRLVDYLDLDQDEVAWLKR